jgi:hypothetical protein
MNYKLLRESYYNEEYNLNPQEEKGKSILKIQNS